MLKFSVHYITGVNSYREQYKGLFESLEVIKAEGEKIIKCQIKQKRKQRIRQLISDIDIYIQKILASFKTFPLHDHILPTAEETAEYYGESTPTTPPSSSTPTTTTTLSNSNSPQVVIEAKTITPDNVNKATTNNEPPNNPSEEGGIENIPFDEDREIEEEQKGKEQGGITASSSVEGTNNEPIIELTPEEKRAQRIAEHLKEREVYLSDRNLIENHMTFPQPGDDGYHGPTREEAELFKENIHFLKKELQLAEEQLLSQMMYLRQVAISYQYKLCKLLSIGIPGREHQISHLQASRQIHLTPTISSASIYSTSSMPSTEVMSAVVAATLANLTNSLQEQTNQGIAVNLTTSLKNFTIPFDRFDELLAQKQSLFHQIETGFQRISKGKLSNTVMIDEAINTVKKITKHNIQVQYEPNMLQHQKSKFFLSELLANVVNVHLVDEQTAQACLYTIQVIDEVLNPLLKHYFPQDNDYHRNDDILVYPSNRPASDLMNEYILSSPNHIYPPTPSQFNLTTYLNPPGTTEGNKRSSYEQHNSLHTVNTADGSLMAAFDSHTTYADSDFPMKFRPRNESFLYRDDKSYVPEEIREARKNVFKVVKFIHDGPGGKYAYLTEQVKAAENAKGISNSGSGSSTAAAKERSDNKGKVSGGGSKPNAAAAAKKK